MNAYQIERFVHLLGAFGFVAAHGATAAITFKLRKESDPGRVRALLDLSRSTRGVMHGSFTLLLLGGVGAGFHGKWWSAGWIWAALVLLVLLFAAAFPLAVPYFKAMRQATEREPPDQVELERLLRSPRGLILAWVETAGILVILYLMTFKPF
ncbi:MAG: DUF2269 family protein [Polyangiaceae bacterium]|nr:DUF2269 family protein [Polyangiaceae bacterium]